MRLLHFGLFAAALAATTVLPATASAGETFADCDSAYNYGGNTAWYYVSSALNRAECVPGQVEKAERTLARSLRRQAIPEHNPEGLRVCFFAGLYQGYADALAQGKSDCAQPLGLLSLARAAAAVFTAMQQNLDYVDNADVDAVFAVAAPAASGDRDDCHDLLADELDESDPGFSRLGADVCD